MGSKNVVNVIKNVTVIDPSSGIAEACKDIHIEGGKITDVLPAGAKDVPGYEGSGLYAVPGLIDTHVHVLGIFMEGSVGLGDLGWVRRQHDKNLEAFARAGVTTIRDMGGPLKMVQAISERAAKKSLSPEVIFAGPVFSVKGGYPYFVKKSSFLIEMITGPVRMYIKSRSSARRAVDAVADEGVQCIKVTFQTMKYDDCRTRIRFFSESWLREIIDRAHYHGLPVAVHNAFQSDIPLFMDLEFDSLEHIVCDAVLTEEEVEKIANKNIPVSATFMTYAIVDFVDQYKELLEMEGDLRFEKKPLDTVVSALEGLGRGESVSKYFGRKIIHESSEIIRKNMALLHEAGVKIVYGTDSCGAITPAGCPHWEFDGMKRAGMSAADILRTATTNAAAAVGRSDLGRLSPGAAADILLLGKNPLDDILNIKEVAAVLKSGKIIHET